MRPTRGQKVFNVFNYTLMALPALTMLLPILHILQLTLSGHPDPSFRLWPRQFTFENYRFVLEQGLIRRLRRCRRAFRGGTCIRHDPKRHG